MPPALTLKLTHFSLIKAKNKHIFTHSSWETGGTTWGQTAQKMIKKICSAQNSQVNFTCHTPTLFWMENVFILNLKDVQSEDLASNWLAALISHFHTHLALGRAADTGPSPAPRPAAAGNPTNATAPHTPPGCPGHIYRQREPVKIMQGVTGPTQKPINKYTVLCRSLELCFYLYFAPPLCHG